jgi:hypothetical protein
MTATSRGTDARTERAGIDPRRPHGSLREDQETQQVVGAGRNVGVPAAVIHYDITAPLAPPVKGVVASLEALDDEAEGATHRCCHARAAMSGIGVVKERAGGVPCRL